MATASPFFVFQHIFGLKLKATIPAAEFAPAETAGQAQLGKLLVAFFPSERAVLITGNDEPGDNRVFLKLHLNDNHVLVELAGNSCPGEVEKCNTWQEAADYITKLHDVHVSGDLQSLVKNYMMFLQQMARRNRMLPYNLVREVALAA